MARSGANNKGGNTDAGTGTIVSGQELARILGISRQYVTNHAKAGMPVHDKNGPRGSARYDSAKCIRWLRDREIQKATGSGDAEEMGIDEIRRRKELAMMKKEEIELAVMEGRYGDVDAILEDLGSALSTIRASLISLPKFAAQLEHQEALVIEKRLEEEIYRMLGELADFTVEDDDDDTD